MSTSPSTVTGGAYIDKCYHAYIETVLFISLEILAILTGGHTIWLTVQLRFHPEDPSSVFIGRLHALDVAVFWTVILCPVFVIFFLKSIAIASILNTAIL